MKLTIHFRYSKPESLKNIKSENRAQEIIASRGVVIYAELDGKVIFGDAPVKEPQQHLTIEQLAKQQFGIS